MQSHPYFDRAHAGPDDPLSNGAVTTHGLNKSSPCLHEAPGNLFFVWVRPDGASQLDVVSLRDGRRRALAEFPASRTAAYSHVDAVCDERGAARRRGNLITRLWPDWECGTMRVEPLCVADSSWRSQDDHPHLVLSADGREVFLNSDVSGVRRIYSVRPELNGAPGVNGAMTPEPAIEPSPARPSQAYL